MKIDISIDMPENIADENKHRDLFDKCCEYMQACESDETSEYHFRYLKSLYKRLSKAKTIPGHLLPLHEKLEEFILKHDSDRTSIDAEDLFKSNNEDNKNNG